MVISEKQTARLGQHVVLCKDTILGVGVSIGNNVTFYPGVTVGDGLNDENSAHD